MTSVPEFAPLDLTSLPAERLTSAADVDAELRGAPRLVVLDDDPTGTQTIRDLPVLTNWSIDDVRWALQQPTSAFFILTNSRSLSPEDAAERNRIVAEACFAAAVLENVEITFASRSDSTLRGHFPLETDVLGGVSAAQQSPIDAIIIAPAYIDAGRITVDSVHWLRADAGFLPVGSSEFARDASFGYRNSHLAAWVEEKTKGRIAEDEVERITLADLRIGGPDRVAARLTSLTGGRAVVVDAVIDDDLRILAIAALKAQGAGKRFLYRVGPSFVRAMTGQHIREPLEAARVREIVGADRIGEPGLIVIGSHVGLTTRQLDRLVERIPVTLIALEVAELLDPTRAEEHLAAVITAAAGALATGTTVLRTTRTVVTGATGEESLAISRLVSAAVVRVVREIVAARRPAFVIAKGGITSSDVATDGLGIARAWVRGPLLAGIVSLWEPVTGPAVGLPYVVFAGNVGDDDALAATVERFAGA